MKFLDNLKARAERPRKTITRKALLLLLGAQGVTVLIATFFVSLWPAQSHAIGPMLFLSAGWSGLLFLEVYRGRLGSIETAGDGINELLPEQHALHRKVWIVRAMSMALYIAIAAILGASGALWWATERLMNNIELAPYFSSLVSLSNSGRMTFFSASIVGLPYIVFSEFVFARTLLGRPRKFSHSV